MKADNCTFRHDINKRAKLTQPNPSPNSFMQQNERKPSRTRSPRGKSPSGRTSRSPCKDYFRGTCNNSFCEKWHPPECLFYKTKSGCRFGEKCSFAHRQVDEQPTKRSKTKDDKSAVAMLKREIGKKENLLLMKAQKQDRFLRGRQIAYLIYEQFRVTGTDSSVENYTDLFTIVLRNDDIQEFDFKWDGILLCITKIPPDDILEGLYKLRIRESEKLRTVLELYDLETHQKKLGPDYHKLKTMVKRSIEQEIRNKNFGSRNENFEKNAVVKNQGTKQRVQRILGDCWQWETNGQCVKGDTCSFRHDINKRGKVAPSNPSPSSFMRQNERNASRTPSPRGKSPSGRMSRWPCKDYLKGTCTNSLCDSGILQHACSARPRAVVGLEKSALICTARLKNSQAKGPKRMVTKVQWLC